MERRPDIDTAGIYTKRAHCNAYKSVVFLKHVARRDKVASVSCESAQPIEFATCHSTSRIRFAASPPVFILYLAWQYTALYLPHKVQTFRQA
jgi:hypothetical protein